MPKRVAKDRVIVGLAVTSLVLGIATSIVYFSPISFFFPFVPVLTGVAAIVCGITSLRVAHRRVGLSRQVAITGIICAALGIVISGSEMVIREFQESETEVTHQSGPANMTLEVKRSPFFKDKLAYVIDQERTNLWDAESFEAGCSGMASGEFFLNSPQVKYTGTYEGDNNHMTIVIALENQVPFQLGIEGLDEVRAKKDDHPFSLNVPIEPGTHTITLDGVIP